jgi:hypothetical protein
MDLKNYLTKEWQSLQELLEKSGHKKTDQPNLAIMSKLMILGFQGEVEYRIDLNQKVKNLYFRLKKNV